MLVIRFAAHGVRSLSALITSGIPSQSELLYSNDVEILFQSLIYNCIEWLLTVPEVLVELRKAGTNSFSGGCSFATSCKTSSIFLGNDEGWCSARIKSACFHRMGVICFWRARIEWIEVKFHRQRGSFLSQHDVRALCFRCTHVHAHNSLTPGGLSRKLEVYIKFGSYWKLHYLNSHFGSGKTCPVASFDAGPEQANRLLKYFCHLSLNFHLRVRPSCMLVIQELAAIDLEHQGHGQE